MCFHICKNTNYYDQNIIIFKNYKLTHGKYFFYILNYNLYDNTIHFYYTFKYYIYTEE